MKWHRWGGVWAAVVCAVLAQACGQQEEQGAREGQSGPVVKATAAALTAAASYDATLKVPRCAGPASGCDSGTLVNGRGPLGPEANAPNTLGGACADGSSGTYHVDESLDRVKVYTTDGSELAAGKQVTVEADVWAWSGGYASDALDLYYTADVSSPNWTFITTLVPAGGGAQTLKATYTLPEGGRVQAVRAVFRYSGSASTCSTGPFDDRDDLAFEVAVPLPPTPMSLGAGVDHSLRLSPDGLVWAWGYNNHGQLGDGTTTGRTTPGTVPGFDNVMTLDGGGDHSVAVRKDGTVWSWGNNSSGQLGDGTLVDRHTPVRVAELTDVKAVVAGWGHVLALKQDGTVWAWGLNGYGQLGDGTTTDRSTPVRVQELSGVKAIAAGLFHSLALMQDGTAWAWGLNGHGQLGDGSLTQRKAPVRVVGLEGVTGLSAGRNHSLALMQDGTVWGWGGNDNGQLGDGTGSSYSLTPVQALGLTDVKAVDASHYFSVALRQDGTVWSWGRNSNGQLGDGSTTQRNSPVWVRELSDIVLLTTGDGHSLALRQDGALWAWGNNSHGQLGDGTTSPRTAPVLVK